MPHPRSTRNKNSGDSSSRNPGKFPQPFLLIIPGLLAIGILIMFFVGKGGTHSKDLLYEDLENRIKRIEQRLSRMEQHPDEKGREMNMRLAERLEKIERAMARPNGPAAPPAEKPVRAELHAKPEQVEREKRVVFHQVAEGETLFKISRAYGVTLDDLRRWNNLPQGEGIRTGQKLRIEKEASSSQN